MSRGEAGMVTAETAMALPVLLVVVAVSAWLLVCVATELRCVDAAAAAARVAARSDPSTSVLPTVRALGPREATVRITRRRNQVEVVVTARVRPFGRLIGLGGLTVSGRAVAEVERTPTARLLPP